MTDRYDAVTVRKDKDGKSRYTSVGVMFRRKEGDGYTLKLNALPLPNEQGEVWISMYPPREKDGERAAPVRAGGGMDDEIPFAPEFR